MYKSVNEKSIGLDSDVGVIINHPKNKAGISLISLIITIIVIIILAAIVIFTGLNTPDRANFAKFAQEISDFRTAITQDFMNRKMQNSINNKSRSDAQVYYAIAKGDYTDDINNKPDADGTVASLNVMIKPEPLVGTDYYEITDDTKVEGWKTNKSYYEARGTNNTSGERHYLTDEGESFILPGYRVEEDGETKWYVNERKYYVSNTPIYASAGAGGGSPEINFEEIMETAIQNRVGTEAIGIGTDGSIVDMNLWYYVYSSTSNTASLEARIGSDSYAKAYLGPFIDGKIVGTVPKYIMPEGENEFCTVRQMVGTFYDCDDLITSPVIPDTVSDIGRCFFSCGNLVTAPIIPNTVTNMYGTFELCESITIIPNLPDFVTNLNMTFNGCTNLTTVPTIPNTLTTMDSTFSNCINLTTVPNIPNAINTLFNTFHGCTSLTTIPALPNSVSNLNMTFDGCTSLTTAPEIPSLVTYMRYTFYGCSKLTGSLVINANPTEYNNCLKNASTDANADLTVSGSSTKLTQIVGTKSSNSNIQLAQ